MKKHAPPLAFAGTGREDEGMIVDKVDHGPIAS
ncbi:hypothetical protein GGR43_001636 [Sphingobium jiangsuense]|uniref:Uncharacterized protein n=1 Tax=Sphingobium jiangsuense TaxID=870476 RepID=A0A7W6BFB8_9SPHN|nr:hypothetical protein [Sphingobium jiangsuense]